MATTTENKYLPEIRLTARLFIQYLSLGCIGIPAGLLCYVFIYIGVNEIVAFILSIAIAIKPSYFLWFYIKYRLFHYRLYDFIETWVSAALTDKLRHSLKLRALQKQKISNADKKTIIEMPVEHNDIDIKAARLELQLDGKRDLFEQLNRLNSNGDNSAILRAKIKRLKFKISQFLEEDRSSKSKNAKNKHGED